MKAKLDHKMNGIRSQTMSFSSNEGLELNFNVPDTEDVKTTFGTVIETVVEQQEELVGLNDTIEVVSAQHAEQQRKIVEWAKEGMQKLSAQNASLLKKVVAANEQIRNFSYNIQGFVDNEDDDTPKGAVSDQSFLTNTGFTLMSGRVDHIKLGTFIIPC